MRKFSSQFLYVHVSIGLNLTVCQLHYTVFVKNDTHEESITFDYRNRYFNFVTILRIGNGNGLTCDVERRQKMTSNNLHTPHQVPKLASIETELLTAVDRIVTRYLTPKNKCGLIEVSKKVDHQEIFYEF